MIVSLCSIYEELFELYEKLMNESSVSDSGGDTVLGDVDLYEVHSSLHKDILQKLLPYHEDVFQEKLKPSAFWGFRKYKNGSELKPHTDMPDTHHRGSSIAIDYSHRWDLYVDGEPISLDKGEMASFNTVDKLHWRKPFRGDFYVNCYVHYSLA